MNKLIVISLSIILLSGAIVLAQSTVTFDNQSGKPALVKLVGPTAATVAVAEGTKQSTNAAAGHYTIKVRYGTPGAYAYSKGDEFDVKETATSELVITITLHAVVNGNYGTRSISKAEFGAEESAKQPVSTSMPAPASSSTPATASIFGFSELVSEQPIIDLNAGHVITHPKTGKKMVLVPTGFVEANKASKNVFGAPELLDDKQQVIGAMLCFGLWKRFVTGFYMDQTEVTNAEYLDYVRSAKADFPKSWEGKEPPDEKKQFPVSVTYAEAERYAKWAGLRLPYLYEFCAAAANKEGIYPWLDEQIATTGKLHLVHSDKRDISPLGIVDLAGNASEWGLEIYSVQSKSCNLAFSFMTLNDKTSWAAALLPERQSGFRCIDELPAITSLAQGRVVGGLVPQQVEGSTFSEVTIENTIDSGVVVMISNGQVLRLPARERETINLPIGYYLVTFKTTDPKHQMIRFWRCQLTELPPGVFRSGENYGNKYTWTLTEKFGEAFPVNAR